MAGYYQSTFGRSNYWGSGPNSRGLPGGYSVARQRPYPPTPYWGVGPNSQGLPQAGGRPSYASVGPYQTQPPPPADRGSQGPQRPDLSHIDYSNDPILARVRALSQEHVQAAEADALAQKQQLVIGYGDPNLANKLNLGGTYAQTAADNPFSTLKELARTYQRRDVFDINRPLSDYHNLFYSSERGRQLALSGEQNLRDQSTAERAVQDRLAAIQQAVVQARMQAQADQLQAEQDAYSRALNAALYGQ